MGNKITEWSYDKPTEPGLYLTCFGDVEVINAMGLVTLYDNDGELEDGDGDSVDGYNSSLKWARLLIGSEAKA